MTTFRRPDDATAPPILPPIWHNRHPNHRLRWVGGQLYVGAQASPTTLICPKSDVLSQAVPFDAVVSLHSGGEYENMRRKALAKVQRVVIWPFDDGAPIPAWLLEAAYCLYRDVRRNPNARMLVHCAAGLSRSASVAYALLRVTDGLSHVHALQRVSVAEYSEYPMPDTLNSARRWVYLKRSGGKL